jgi:SecD/SecF fusion protein
MKYPIWKPLLIVAVLAGCAAILSVKGLKPGIDLAGGTTLVYDVLVPEGKDAKAVINDTIAIQRNRVDPTGTKNLIWRPEAGDRLAVTMAQAPPIVGERREAAEQAEEALLKASIDPVAVDSALRIKDEQARQEAFAKLAGSRDELKQQLTELYELKQQRDQKQQTYEQAEQAFEDAQPEDADAELSDAQQTEVDKLQTALEDAADAFLSARDAFDQKRQAILADTIQPAEIARIRALTDQVQSPLPDAISPREEAFVKLAEQHSNQKAEIEQLAAALKAYEEVKGPLDDPKDLIAILKGAGVLEFRIAATPQGDAGGQSARPISAQPYLDRLAEKGPRAGLDEDFRWFPVQSLEEFVDEEVIRNQLIQEPEMAGELFRRRGLVGQEYGGQFYVLLGNSEDLAMTSDEGWKLTSVTRSQDDLGKPAVSFSLDGIGAGLLGNLTGPNVGRQMAIVLDGELMSAPRLNDRLSSGGIITGDFNVEELNYLIRTLRAGSLEGQLSPEPISIQTTGPALGKDNLQKGLRACVLALIIVAIFMAGYYLFAGLVADFALLANMVIILGVMSLLEATFTLPGIAGLVLTIGMAVDANVLIFERIREEIDAKADLTTAVRLGFGKALSTILDANLTTLITCVVLGYTATAEVKGFAVVLGIGILATLFTALFSTRVIVEAYLKLFKAKRLPMLPTLIPALKRLLEPNINWIGLRKLFMPISAVLIIAGLSMVFIRGSDLLDIEFRSGTEVTFELAQGEAMPIQEVRDRLKTLPGSEIVDGIDTDGPVDWQNLADAQVVTVGDEVEGGGTSFSVATLVEDADAVSEAIKALFRDKLDTTESIDFAGEGLTVGEAKGIVEPITAGSLSDVYGGKLFNEGDTDLGEFVGGVAVLLENVEPALSVADVQERITRMSRQPAYEGLGYRQREVIGLNRVGSNDQGQPTYSTLAVVSRDQDTNYAEDRTDFTESAGLAATEWDIVRDALQRDTSLASVSNFSSQVSGTMKQKAIVALALSLLAVVGYIWLRFGSIRYGMAAIVALVHDVSITLGILAICGWLSGLPGFEALLLDDFKINLTLVAAVLTIVGYSLNDTIVVFDRIRENRGRLARATPAIINQSINQTISRTVLTSGTTLIAVLILYIFGGPGVHGFAFAMLIGILVGTYSSVAVAAPALLIGDKAAKSTQVTDRDVTPIDPSQSVTAST